MLKRPFFVISALICGVFGLGEGDLPAETPSGPVSSAEASTARAGTSAATPPQQGGRSAAWHQNAKLDATPQQRLASAIWAAEARRAVSARIRHKTDLFGKQLIGSGTYMEQRQDPVPLLKLELKIQLGQETSSLMQVCDGQYLWTYRKLFQNGSLRRLDAVRATEALEEAATTKRKNNPNEKVEMLPGLGGLAQLLRGLYTTFDFVSAEKGTLESKPGRMVVWRLEGQWKKEQLANLLPDRKEAMEAGKPIDLGELPEHLPDRVVLFIGAEDRFPYRIEYRRRSTEADSDSGNSGGREIVTMEWLDVVMDRPVDPRRFEYNPAGLGYEDTTAKFLARLKKQ